MKRLFVLACAVMFAFVFVGTAAADTKITFKKGDEVYVCGCGAGCACLTMSKKAGKCGCGKDLVKTKIDKVVKGKAYVKVDGKTMIFKTTGKYACACGSRLRLRHYQPETGGLCLRQTYGGRQKQEVISTRHEQYGVYLPAKAGERTLRPKAVSGTNKIMNRSGGP